MIRHIFNNIKSLIKTSKMFVFLLIFIQLMSVVVIFSTYGIINNYSVKLNEIEGSIYQYEIYSLEDDPYQKREDILAFYDNVLPVVEKKLRHFGVEGKTYSNKLEHGGMLLAYGEYREGIICPSGIQKSLKGHNFTDEQVLNGEKVVIISQDFKYENVGSYIDFDGEDYKLIKIYRGFDPYLVLFPFSALPKDAQIGVCYLTLNSPLTRTEHEAVYEISKRYLGSVNFPEFDGIENESEYRVYRNMIFVLIAIVTICGINYCIIYQYLIKRNRSAFAVIRICGCKRGRAVFGYVLEMLIESAALFGIGMLIFKKWLLNGVIAKYFEYATYYYDTHTYWFCFAVYMAVLFVIYLIQIIGYVKVTPAKLMKEV